MQQPQELERRPNSLRHCFLIAAVYATLARCVFASAHVHIALCRCSRFLRSTVRHPRTRHDLEGVVQYMHRRLAFRRRRSVHALMNRLRALQRAVSARFQLALKPPLLHLTLQNRPKLVPVHSLAQTLRIGAGVLCT
jgi:hypothetical protein